MTWEELRVLQVASLQPAGLLERRRGLPAMAALQAAEVVLALVEVQLERHRVVALQVVAM